MTQVPVRWEGANRCGFLRIRRPVALSWSQSPPGFIASGNYSASGLLSGIPDYTGTFAGAITASAMNGWVTRNISLVVNPGPLSVAEQSLPDARSGGGAYSSTLTGVGGTQPFTWSLIAGSLPRGLTLDASTGEILGGATTAGFYTFTIQVADSGIPQQTATRAFTLNVVGP